MPSARTARRPGAAWRRRTARTPPGAAAALCPGQQHQGKDDPTLALLRLDPDHAQIWLNGSSLVAGIKVLLGIDPRRDYQDKVADVPLR
ncbi:hypothetical protein Y886_13145 [Xanthomonas hyacinthi DSM 19077]|nr:hypothetical protein Y886_13145 [Xanthomonas hyacinthi DSM 19077]